MHKTLPKVGDTVIVDATPNFPAKVSRVTNESETARTRIDLDFGVLGKSRVYAHDEGRVWHRIEDFN